MITSFGKKVFAAYSRNVLPHVDLSASMGSLAYCEFKNVSGDTKYCVPWFYDQSDYNFTLVTDTTHGGVAFGSGTTAPTEDDYDLESMITTITATATNPAFRIDPETNDYCMYIDYVISNNTENDITISEIGRFGLFRYADTIGGGVTGSKAQALLDRVVLENPVVIPSGDAGTVRYELVLN